MPRSFVGHAVHVPLLAALVSVLVTGGIAASPAGATVVRAMALDAQSIEADRIFVGTVRSAESRPRPADPRYFETIVTFDVEEPVAGTMPSSTVALRFSGGRVGDVEQVVDGMPRFEVGERYVVMLAAEQDPPLVSPVVGFNQGLYRVVSGEGGSVVRDRHGKPLEGAASAAAGRAAAGEPTLDAFLDGIRAARSR